MAVDKIVGSQVRFKQKTEREGLGLSDGTIEEKVLTETVTAGQGMIRIRKIPNRSHRYRNRGTYLGTRTAEIDYWKSVAN